MDANGLKFWLLADGAHWSLPGDPPALEYDTLRRSLRLARQRRDVNLAEDRDVAKARLETVPQARDGHGNRAWYDADLGRILAVGVSDTPQQIYALAPAMQLTDMALGEDGVLYLAVDGAVVMHDRRQRWRDVLVGAPGFHAWRLSPTADGGVWVLDRDHRQLARVCGYPVSDRANKPYRPDVIRPCNENANPPRLVIMAEVAWPAEEIPVALACSLDGELACLSWRTGGDAVIRSLTDAFALGDAITLLGSGSPYSLAWVASGQVAVLVFGESTDAAAPEPTSEARVYGVDFTALLDAQDDATETRRLSLQFPCGDLYPLKRDYNFGPFIHGLDYPPHYPSFDGSHGLHRLSFPFFTRQGEAFNAGLHRQLDSADVNAIWHRLYVEAAIPAGCGVRIWLAASNAVIDHRNDPELQWFEHRFGERYQHGGRSDIPVGSWASLASELPYHPGLLPCGREPQRKGLFSALIQRGGLKVRSLRGRYLYVKVELSGPGNATPELFAVRAYAGRFSYVEHYLPRLYWERTFAPEADAAGDATQADFFERYINNFEGMLTSLEDRVACSDLVTRPQTVPIEALEWLAQWIGFQFEAGWSTAQRRRFLERAADLYQWHGTIRGLNLALEIATDGAVSGGEIVVLEDYRLRRTFATVIGADLDDEEDPLTLGGIETGNAFVGDTLFIGDEQRREFLALFSADLEVSDVEAVAIDAFFERLAFRVTILVHQNVEPQSVGTIERIAEREIPAHVQFRILTSSAPLLAGLTSLLGVDTYLTSRRVSSPARVNRSTVGRGDYVMGPATLDPRLEGIGSGKAALPAQPPVARAADVSTPFGADFSLDGSASEAAPGRSLSTYHWRFIDQGDA